METGGAHAHTNGGGSGSHHERDSAEVALAAATFALEATGDRAPTTGSDGTAMSDRYGWPVPRMPYTANHGALSQPHTHPDRLLRNIALCTELYEKGYTCVSLAPKIHYGWWR